MIIAYDGSPAARQAVVDAAKVVGSCRILVATVWEEGLAYAEPAMPSPDTMMLSTPIDPEVSLELDHAFHQDAERVSREGPRSQDRSDWMHSLSHCRMRATSLRPS